MRSPRCLQALLLALVAGTAFAQAKTEPPFHIVPGEVRRIETGLPEDFNFRQPIWTLPGSDSTSLALQAYAVTGVHAIVTVPAVARQMARDGKVTVGLTYPPSLKDRAGFKDAMLLLGSWYSYREKGKPPVFGLLYSSNAITQFGKARFSATAKKQSLWFGGAALLEARGDTAITEPNSIPASPVVVCRYGALGTPGDLGAFRVQEQCRWNLTNTPSISEDRPALSPDGKVVAYLVTSQAEAKQTLNVMPLKSSPTGILSGTPQFPGDASDARRALGIVAAFSWCPKTFVDPGRGTYNIIAYYRQRVIAGLGGKPESAFDLWVVPVSAAGRLMTTEAFEAARDVYFEYNQVTVAPPAWHPDGEHLFYLSTRPGVNPLQVADIGPTAHGATPGRVVPVWSLEVWSQDAKSQPQNVSVACSGDGRFLSLIALGRSMSNENIYYEQAYVVPIHPD